MEVTLAHSPDSDDAYMFYALACGRIETGPYEFRHILEDIESLNRAAAVGQYAVSAISFHNYPFVQDRYQLMRCGASVGNTYGPIIVSKDALTPADFRAAFTTKANAPVIAIPGEKTTAFLALKIFHPEFRFEAVPFDQIMPGVLAGRYAAGLVIHEGQLNFAQEGLKKVVDLGVWWRQETGLPLPLGGNVIRRDLGAEHIREISALLKRSIEFALDPANQPAALEYAMAFARGLDRAQAERFVSMYVNRHTVEIDEDCKKAVGILYERGHELGMIPKVPELEFV